MFSKFKSEACEIQCRLCLGRIKLMRNKRGLQLKQSRKDVAELLRSGKQEYARIRVEGVIREQLMLQAYEVLELYMELLTVRAQLVAKTKEIPRDMVEAISSIIYAAERVGDFPELLKLRKMFETKYGPEYVREATNDATRGKWQVNANLIRCLLVEAPQPEDKLATLSEIAQDHGVEWDLSAAARDLLPPEAPPSLLAGGGAPATPLAPPGSIPMMPLPMGHGPPQQQQQLPPSGPMAFGYGPGSSGGGGAPGYTDANQAAAAANHAATQARAAADYAAQFALHQAGLMAPAASPSDGWLMQQAQQVQQAGGAPPRAPSPAEPYPASEHGAAAGSVGYVSNGSAGGAGKPAGSYTGKSNEEIQRAYDEALGAPNKHSATAPAPPAPGPPAPDFPHPPSHVANVAMPPPPTVPGSLNLPAPPAGRVQPGAPAGPEDEYEALTRRLEALKRS